MTKTLFCSEEDQTPGQQKDIKAQMLLTLDNDHFGLVVKHCDYSPVKDLDGQLGQENFIFFIYDKATLKVIKIFVVPSREELVEEIKNYHSAPELFFNGGVCRISNGCLIFQANVLSWVERMGESPGADSCLQTIRLLIIEMLAAGKGLINVDCTITAIPQEYFAEINLQLLLIRRFYTPLAVLPDVIMELKKLKAYFSGELAEQLFPESLYTEMEEENRKKEATITKEKEPEKS